MPEDLRRAHDRNDEVLERIYIGRRFKNDTERLEKLFALYTQMTSKWKIRWNWPPQFGLNWPPVPGEIDHPISDQIDHLIPDRTDHLENRKRCRINHIFDVNQSRKKYGQFDNQHEQNKTDSKNVQPGPQQALDSGADWCFP